MNPLRFVLSEKDGQPCFFVDNSSLNTLVCPRFYELKHICGRELVAARAGRNFGAGLHVGWQRRYSLCGSSAVDAKAEVYINDGMMDYFREKPQPENDFRTLAHAQRIMQVYNERYRNEPFEILKNAKGQPAVESSFAFPIGDVVYPSSERLSIKIIFTGRVDLFTRDNEGEWAGPDHKTTSELGNPFMTTMATDSGQKGYCWAFQQIYGRLPRGYIINAVRIRKPRKMDLYTGEAPIDASDFLRIPHYVFPSELEEWREDVLAKVETIFWMHHRGYFQRHTSRCSEKYGRCDMYDVCISQRESRDTVLASSLFEDYTWSPLNKETKE